MDSDNQNPLEGAATPTRQLRFAWLSGPRENFFKRSLRQRALVLGAVGFAMAASILVTAWALSNREPYYHHKPFSYWLARVPCTYVAPAGATVSFQPVMIYTTPFLTRAEAEAALEESKLQADQAMKAVNLIGGKCLPLLVERLQSKDSPAKIWLIHWAIKIHLVAPSWFQPADIKRGQALTAIIKQGYSAKPILNDLAILARDKDPAISAAAKYALEQLKPEEFERLEKLQRSGK